MHQTVIAAVFCVGAGGWLAALVWAVRRRPVGPVGPVAVPALASAAAAALVFLAAMPSTPPFATGHAFGRGFALGIAAGIAAMPLLARFTATETVRQRMVLLAGSLSPVLCAACLPPIAMRLSQVDALMAVAIGLTCAFGLYAVINSAATPQTCGALGATLAAAFSAILLSSEAMAAMRATNLGESLDLSAGCLVVGAGVIAAVWAGALPWSWGRRSGSARWHTIVEIAMTGASAAALPVIAAAAVGTSLLGSPAAWQVVAAGALSFLLIRWLLSSSASAPGAAPDGDVAWQPALALPVLAGAGFVGFSKMGGLGVALAAAATIPGAAAAIAVRPPDSEAGDHVAWRLISAPVVLALIVLFRVAGVRYADLLPSTPLHEVYPLLMMSVGAAAPTIAARYAGRSCAAGRALWRLSVAAVICAGLPAALTMALGARSASTLYYGLILCAAAPLLFLARSPVLAGIAALGMGLAPAQWLGRIVTWADLSRAERANALTQAVGGVCCALVVGEIIAWLFARQAARKGAETT